MSASHETTGTRAVPLSELWEYYADLNPLTFSVKECGFDEFKGGYATGDLARATTRAASAWERAVPGIRIAIQIGNCDVKPSFRNDQNEIYWAPYSNGNAELGDYMGFFLLEGELVEHDITADSTALGNFVERDGGERQAALYNLVLHELGHALGLGDAYLVDTRSCNWSVMLMQCPGPRQQPTAQDAAAVQHIHGFAPQTSTTPPPQSPPSSPPLQDPVPEPPADDEPSKRKFHPRLYDLNGNGFIDDEELFTAIDIWAQGGLTDAELNTLVDAWIARVRVQSIHRQTSSHTPTAIDIYDTSGRLISRLDCGMGDPNSRTHMALERERAPKGVYITSVRDCWTNQMKVVSGLYQG